MFTAEVALALVALAMTHVHDGAVAVVVPLPEEVGDAVGQVRAGEALACFPVAHELPDAPVVGHFGAACVKLAPAKDPARRGNHDEGPQVELLCLLDELLVGGHRGGVVAAVARLVGRVADDDVELHAEDLTRGRQGG